MKLACRHRGRYRSKNELDYVQLSFRKIQTDRSGYSWEARWTEPFHLSPPRATFVAAKQEAVLYIGYHI